MEALTRLVSESFARHGFDRPLDYRRLQWSRWFRCESPHSLLFVPSKPGVFALAEEMMDLGAAPNHGDKKDHVETAASAVPRSEASGPLEEFHPVEDRRLSSPSTEPRRLLAVAQFFDADDMAYVLDRMLFHQNSMRARLASGRYFVRFVVIEDESQRRSICNALNQWILTSAEKTTGIGSHFATSLELTPQTESLVQTENVARTLLSATAFTTNTHVETAASAVTDPSLSSKQGEAASTATTHAGPDAAWPEQSRRVRPAERSEAPSVMNPALAASTPTTPQLNSGAATNIHCPFPSGF